MISLPAPKIMTSASKVGTRRQISGGRKPGMTEQDNGCVQSPDVLNLTSSRKEGKGKRRRLRIRNIYMEPSLRMINLIFHSPGFYIDCSVHLTMLVVRLLH